MTSMVLKQVILLLLLVYVQGMGLKESLTTFLSSLGNFQNGPFMSSLFEPLDILTGFMEGIFSSAKSEYDFVIVGAGPSGACLANRLSENPAVSVLVIEAGGKSSVLTDVPGLVGLNMFTDLNYKYKSEPIPNFGKGLIGHTVSVHQGKALGGTTTINYMIATRGNKIDYDLWGAKNPGWSYKDVLPYFQALEQAHVEIKDEDVRGSDGHVYVSDIAYRSESVQAFVKAAQEAGHKYIDYNGHTRLGISYMQGTVRNGLRFSAEKACLDPIASRKNIKILTRAQATEILFKGNRASGVRYVKNGLFKTVKAKREVIVSAGSFNSPKLLMLSGIGPRDLLKSLDIPLRKDLPVGRKIYDHLVSPVLTFKLNSSITITLKDFFNPSSIPSYLSGGKGVLSTLGGMEAIGYLQALDKDQEDYPDIEMIFAGGHIGYDFGLFTRQSFGINLEAYNRIWKPLEGKHACMTFPVLLHPKSFGNMTIRSKDYRDPPRIHHNYLAEKEDIQTLVAAVKEILKIYQQPAMQHYGAELVQVPVPGCEGEEFLSDAYWECALRHLSLSLWHDIGACRMGPEQDPEAVVNNKLQVHGIQNLRVVDISIIPNVISSHTSIPAYMIAENAARIIKKDHNL